MNKETIILNEKAIKIASEKIRKTYTEDKILMQAVQALQEEEHIINTEYERLREMYWRYNPEILDRVKEVKQLINMILNDEPKSKESMGYDINNTEMKLIKDYANEIKNHLKVTNILESFINQQAKKLMPETSNEATPVIAAKLMNLAGGIKDLALLPASTIQLLGAEKALFRHLRTGAKPPKHGVILYQPKVQAAKNKGKAARQEANKISILIRKDYFGGKNK